MFYRKIRLSHLKDCTRASSLPALWQQYFSYSMIRPLRILHFLINCVQRTGLYHDLTNDQLPESYLQHQTLYLTDIIPNHKFVYRVSIHFVHKPP